MSADYFTELPPELILLLPPSLSTSSLSAFTLTCRRIREILQPELEARLTPELATQIFLWAVASDKPHIVAKLLSPPHSINLSGGAGLDIATKAGNKEIVALLLEAGADPATPWDQDGRQALHLAARNNDLEMMKLLLDHGAPIDDQWGPDGWRQNALHFACLEENIEMIDLLLSRGADLEIHGTFGTALGVAVHFRKIDAVKFLLHKGAKAEVTVPHSDGGPAFPHKANLLYIAMRLRVSSKVYRRGRRQPQLTELPKWEGLLLDKDRKILMPLLLAHRHPQRQLTELPKWEGLPLDEDYKILMALLLAHGASKVITMETIVGYLGPLAEAAKHAEDEYLEIVKGMIKEAEDAIPDLSIV